MLHIGQQMDHHLTATLPHPKDGQSFLLHGVSTNVALPSASTALSALALDHFWLSLMASNPIGLVTLPLAESVTVGLFYAPRTYLGRHLLPITTMQRQCVGHLFVGQIQSPEV